MPPAPRKKPTRSTKKPYHYSKDALEKELQLIMEGSAPTPKKKPTIAERFPPRQKPKLSSVSFERLRQKYADKAAKLDLGEEVDEAVWATHPDDTRSSALLNLLEPYLRENPMAQLGFDVVGGGEGIMKLFIDSMENMPQRGVHVPELGFTSTSLEDIIIEFNLRKEHKEQNIEALTGFKDPFKAFHSSGKKRPFVMYRDAVGTEWPEEDAAATNIDRQIKQGLATLIHELGHAGDDYLRSESGTRKLGEQFQLALDIRREEKFKEGPHKLPELRKGPTASDPASYLKWRKEYSKRYPRPYEHPYMERSLKVLLNRLSTPPERGKVID